MSVPVSVPVSLPAAASLPGAAPGPARAPRRGSGGPPPGPGAAARGAGPSAPALPLPEVLEFLGWRAAAACSGLPAHVVFSRREAEARPALLACGRCPVVRECEETVAPAESWFDGVSAGRLWRNGRPVAPRGRAPRPA
ncbi:WhiB family transcriptional regulator [Streptomyces sp. SP18CS02]|uniref:WhiB family transcriptional regulator n=1 Tax=Streptomyces sp. SP18CS02 TaxID=3002531 RepID=UPI002E79C23F|nr:WhiB family transcriptional regulator [Streptomyces sp. SP18CS02]MEE1751726.1 WhiB family transcriptional regulator [Streptomyces sp. SP18CS02]